MFVPAYQATTLLVSLLTRWTTLPSHPHTAYGVASIMTTSTAGSPPPCLPCHGGGLSSSLPRVLRRGDGPKLRLPCVPVVTAPALPPPTTAPLWCPAPASFPTSLLNHLNPIRDLNRGDILGIHHCEIVFICEMLGFQFVS